MKKNLILKDTSIINEGSIIHGDVLIENDRIERVGGVINKHGVEISGENKWLIPGIIDDQVHFREPGLTHKADIQTESKAAVAGGVTTFMEMPNTKPAALTQELLQDKYNIASKSSWCNYSFFMGTSNDNYEEIMKTDWSQVCGLKIFMGSSTGNMLVDDDAVLNMLFSNVPALIATHCEDEATILQNSLAYQDMADLKASHHPIIRNEEACYKSSSFAVDLAKKHNTRLHVLHISTAEELKLFTNTIPLSQKTITSEVCVHHLYFSADDYAQLGNLIKCNPAIKASHHREELLAALIDDRLDIIATDHAPHTLAEKMQAYKEAPSGLPLVQHALNIMLDFVNQGKLTIQQVVNKMCHAPAECFKIKNRGYIREGYYADLAILDPKKVLSVTKDTLHYKCGWSPLEGKEFMGTVTHTIVNGDLVYADNLHREYGKGMRIEIEK